MPDQLESDAHMFPGAAPLSKDSIANNHVKQAEGKTWLNLLNITADIY